MGKPVIILISFIILLYSVAESQEVLITDFPPGISSVDSSFFEPYYSRFESIADTLKKYPLAKAVITGGADGIKFSESHDSKNPGLAIGRAHVIRNLLVDKFDINPNRIVVQSNDVIDQGSALRYASVHIDRDLANIESRLDTLSRTIPEEKSVSENMGLQLGIGFSSSPFGGIPVATGAITWKRFVFVEGIIGHTFWNNSFRLEDANLSTRRRMAGGLVSVYPLSKIPGGLVAGWIRIEEISQRYNEYVRMSEGPVIGLRATPIDFFSITAIQNTSKHNIIGDFKSRLKNKQFLLIATVHVIFGGGK